MVRLLPLPALQSAVVRLSWGYGYAWMGRRAEDPAFALAALLRSGAGTLSPLQLESYAALHGIYVEPTVSEKTFDIMAVGPVGPLPVPSTRVRLKRTILGVFPFFDGTENSLCFPHFHCSLCRVTPFGST